MYSVFAAFLLTNFLQAPPPSNETPSSSRVYGNQFTNQIDDTQSAAAIGSVDALFAASGSLDLDSIYLSSTALCVETLPNGNFLVVLNDFGGDSVVAQYNAEGVLQTSYGSSGIVNLPNPSITPRATMIDAQGRLLVAGGDNSGTNGWIYRISTDGLTVTTFATSSNWQDIGGLAQQRSGKILAVGFNGSNAQIARYNLDGSLDITFGASGFIVLNGSGLPTSIRGLYSVTVEQSDDVDLIYQFYTLALDSTNEALFLAFSENGVYNSTSTTNVAILNDAVEGSFKLALNQDGNTVLAGNVGGVIKVAGLTNSGGSSGFTDFLSTTINTDIYNLNNIMTSSGGSNGYLYLIGSNRTTNQMAVIRLNSNSGVLDTVFNGTGYNFFNVAGTTDILVAQLYDAALAPDGQLYVPGSQVYLALSRAPYISRLNSTQYAREIAQFPAAQEQGILDSVFGFGTRQTYKGVVNTFNGKYGSSLQQRAQDAVEITTGTAGEGLPSVGDMVIGMNGFIDTSSQSNMMFSWLLPTGTVNTAINSSSSYPGYLTLANTTSTNEYLTSILQGPSGVVFVAGYASDTVGGATTQAILRAYSPSSTSSWTSGDAAWSAVQPTALWKGVGVGYQSNSGTAAVSDVLFFVDEGDGTGHISGYTNLGVLDSNFGVSGTISSTSFGLHMGPSYGGGLVSSEDNIFTGYRDSSDNYIKVAAFLPNGSALLDTFGDPLTPGVSVPLFGSDTGISSENVRICFNQEHDIAIAGTLTHFLYITLISGETGNIDPVYAGGNGYLSVDVIGSTSLQLRDLIGVSDGSVIVTFYDNATDDTMYLARITLTGELDTTFNSQGAQPGILPIQIGDRASNYNARIATSSLIQSTAGSNQGNIVMSGYESILTADATPVMMRSFGQPGTTQVMSYPIIDSGVPGTFDIAFDLVTDLGNAAAKVVYTYPSGNVHEGYSLIGYDNGTVSSVARYDITTNELDDTFGTGGIYSTGTGYNGISTLMVDAQNNIVIGGTNGSTPWAIQVADDGDSAVLFDAFPTGMVAVNQILQQSSGRYIVAGNIESGEMNYGMIVAFQDELPTPNLLSATTLAIDETFNPLAMYTQAGTFMLGADGLYSIAINNDDTILAAYTNGAAVVVADITADGSGLVSGFNGGNVLTTSIGTDSAATCRVAINSSGYFVIAASSGAGLGVQLGRYDAAGTFDPGFNSGAVLSVYNVGSAGVTLSDLMITTENQTIFLGYNTAGGNGLLFAGRLNTAGTLDSTWNPSAVSPDTAGVLTFDTNSVTQMNGSAMTIDGKIIAVGQQSGGTAGDPVVMYIYGDNYVTQVTQAPLEYAAGVLDLTIPSGSSGAAALSVTGVPTKAAIYNNTSNGAVMVASSNGTNSYVTMLNANLVPVDTATYGTNGVATLAGKTSINDMYLVGDVNSDTLAPILVTGATAGAMWGATISANGDTITYLANAGGMTTGNVIRQTNNGRILVAGYNGAVGCIAAFESVTSSGEYPLDLSFGNNNGTSPNYGGGVYSTGALSQVYAMVVDQYDRIYIAYVSGTTITIERLLANGTAVDTTYNATFSPTSLNFSASQIRLALDMENSQLVVAAQNGQSANNVIQVCRFDTELGTATGASSAITISSRILNLSDLFIDAEQNIYLVGYSTIGNAIVARFVSVDDSTIALDTTGYAVAGGTPGIANVDTGSMSVVKASAYSPDRRTYIFGSDGSTNGYIGRVYGDIYTTQVSQAIATAEVGSIDTSLQPNNTGQIDLSGQTGWSGLVGYKAYAIIENPNNDGTSFIAFGNGTNLIVGKVNADMTPVTAFGAAGLTTGLTMATVNSIALDSDSNIIVAGVNSGAQKVVMFNPAGSLIATFSTSVASTAALNVVQQKSGRYIVAGSGKIIAYQNQSAISSASLPVDQTFGPAGSNGFFTVSGATVIDDLCIDSNDNIYFVYRNSSNVVCLGKLTANGSGLVNAQNSPATFNSGAIVTTGITSAASTSHIAINSDGNILVGAQTFADDIKIQLYNGSTGASLETQQTAFGGGSPVLTKLVGSETEFYGSFYSTVPVVGVFAVTAAGILDTAFGTAGVTSVTGSVYQYPQAMYGLSVQADGKLITVGYNNPSHDTTSFNPSLLRFFGYQYISQFAQAPNRVAAGQLDTTLWPTAGAFLLNGTTNSTFNSLITGYAVKRVYEAGNGVMTFVADNGSNTVVFQLLKDLTLNTAFSGDGYVSFIGGHGGTTGLYVDSLENLYICGTNSTPASWVIGMTSDGADLTPAFSATSTLTAGNAIGQQSNSRVILAGITGGNGTLKGYNNTGALDVTFATGGILGMGISTAITDMTIDPTDRIITVANNSGSVVLQRATASGLAGSGVAAVTTLTGGTAITGAVSGSSVKVVLDNGGRIVVAAATSTGYALRSYNNNATGTDIGSVSIAPTGGSGTFTLGNIYATNDNKITLVGYRASGQIVVARFTSEDGGLTLDTSSFDAAGTQPGILYTTIGSLNQVNDGIIHADNRVMVVGSNSGSANPYMGRTFGYPYATYTSQGPIEGVAGTIDPGFGNTSPTTGTFDLSTLNSLLVGGQGKAILPVANGGYYMAFDDSGDGHSYLIKTTASGALDTSYNLTGIATSYAPLGVNSILQDGSGNVLLMGTLSGTGWVQRYTPAGVLDTTFNGTGIITIASTQATVAVEQTLGRLVVAGLNPFGKGGLVAYKSLAPTGASGAPGTLDTTFNSTGTYPGGFSTDVSNIIPSLVADSYDRLIFGILNPDTNDVDLYRLTPTGEYDITFGIGGIVSGAILDASGASSVRVALDHAGNIIVASNSQVTNTFSVAAYDNGTSTTTGANGLSIYAQSNINLLTHAPSVTSMVTSADGYVLILGNQSGTNPAWIARITPSDAMSNPGTLDTTGFNPAAVGADGVTGNGIAGIFQYTDTASGGYLVNNVYAGLAVNANGTLGMLGYSFIGVSPSFVPLLIAVYDNPYTSQIAQSPNSKPVGTNDVTLGVSPESTTNKGILFFGSSTGNIASGQVARSIALYDDNNVVVAIDGNSAAGSGNSSIMMNMFDNDGILNSDFGTNGQQTVLSMYQNQYVSDMITFTTVSGVTKAILAGYVYNSVLARTDSLVLQYILTPGSSALDDSFGGFDGNPSGIAFGDGKSLFSVGQQTTGRIVAAGLAQNDLGLLLGYGADGRIDNSFGNNGYQSVNTGTTGIYTHAIDSNDRIVFAYNNGSDAVAVARYLPDGSGLDTTFTTPTPLIATISGNTNMKVAVDSGNNVHVAGVVASTNSIMVKIYPQAGGTATYTITLTGTNLGSPLAEYVLGRMIVDAAGNTIIVAYDGYQEEIVVIRLTPALVLDSTFNNGAGYIKYTVSVNTLAVNDAMIHPDGRIFVAGAGEDVL